MTALALPAVQTEDPERRAFLDARRSGIGSSDTPAIFGISPFKTPLDVFLSKTGQVEDAGDTHTADWGRELETAIARVWARQTGLRPRRVRQQLRSVEWPWMIANLDRELGPDIVEVKYVPWSKDWHEPPEGAPPYVKLQALHQLAVTGKRLVIVVALFRAELRQYVVERDDRAITGIVEETGRFWREHVETGIPPELDGSDAAREYLRRRFPGHVPGKELTATAEQQLLVDEYRAADEAADRAAAIRDALETRVQAVMGDADTFAGRGFRFTWRLTKPTEGVNWEPVAQGYRTLAIELWEALRMHEGTRPFPIALSEERPLESTHFGVFRKGSRRFNPTFTEEI